MDEGTGRQPAAWMPVHCPTHTSALTAWHAPPVMMYPVAHTQTPKLHVACAPHVTREHWSVAHVAPCQPALHAQDRVFPAESTVHVPCPLQLAGAQANSLHRGPVNPGPHVQAIPEGAVSTQVVPAAVPHGVCSSQFSAILALQSLAPARQKT